MARTITKTVYTFEELLATEKTGEVSRDAVAIARCYLTALASDPDWYRFDYELWEAALDEIGFENAEIQFSGFSSQGDGASFTAAVDLPKMTKFLSAKIEPEDCIGMADGKEVFSPWLVHQISGQPHPDPKYSKLSKLVNDAEMKVVRNGRLRYVHERSCIVEADLHDRGDLLDSPDSANWVWESKQRRTRALWMAFVDDVERLRRDCCQALYASLEASYEALTSDESLAACAEARNCVFDAQGRQEEY